MLNTQQFHQQLRLFDPDQGQPRQMSLDLKPIDPIPSRPATTTPLPSRQSGIRHSYGEMTQRQWSTHMRLSRMGL